MSSRRRTLILTATLLQLAVFAALFAWRAAVWNGRGWAGMTFSPAIDAEAVGRVLPGVDFSAPGAVAWIVNGSPAERAGITLASFVTAIDGIPVADVDALRRHAREVRPGATVTYAITYGIEEAAVPTEEVRVELISPFDRLDLVVDMAVGLVVGLAFLAISFLVTWARPRSEEALVFYWMSAAGAATFLLLAANEVDLLSLAGLEPIGLDPYIWWVQGSLVVLALALTNLLFHLALIFPRRRPAVERAPKVFWWLHTVPFLPAVMLVTAFVVVALMRRAAGVVLIEVIALVTLLSVVRSLRRAPREDDGWRALLARRPLTAQLALVAATAALTPLGLLVPRFVLGTLLFLATVAVVAYWGFVFFVYSIATCVALYRNYREAGIDEKRQVRWPLWGMVVSVCGILAVAATATAIFVVTGRPAQESGIWVNLAKKLVYLPIPLSFAFGILRYRLLQIDVILKKTLVYAGMTFFVLMGYVLLVGGLGFVALRAAGVESQVVTIVATLAIAGLFVPVKNRLQAFVDRRFQQGEAGRGRGPETRAEMEQALAIQRSLLPESLPERPGLELAARWQPARQVAGDYYDVLELDGGELGLCVADIAGKGLPAALLMSSLRVSLRAAAPRHTDTAEVCGEVRELVCESLAGGRFVTLFYARLAGDRLRYCNAGHNPPILLRGDGSVERLEGGGDAVALLFRGQGYRQSEVRLRAGDRLVLFTDGVTEARDASGEMLGEEALVELVRRHAQLGAAELCDELLAAVTSHARGDAQDDVTLLVAAVV